MDRANSESLDRQNKRQRFHTVRAGCPVEMLGWPILQGSDAPSLPLPSAVAWSLELCASCSHKQSANACQSLWTSAAQGLWTPGGWSQPGLAHRKLIINFLEFGEPFVTEVTQSRPWDAPVPPEWNGWMSIKIEHDARYATGGNGCYGEAE